MELSRDNSRFNRTNKFSFDFRKFRKLKKKVKRFLVDKYSEDIYNQFLSNKEVKEAFYKFILGFPGYIDVFNSGRSKDIMEFDFDEKAKNVILKTKKYVMNNLYEN